MLVNILYAQLVCPHCRFSGEMEVEARLDGFGPRHAYRVGDTVHWRAEITEDYPGRPPLGDLQADGYVVCPSCGKDFFAIVGVERDNIVGVTPDTSRPGYMK